MVRLLPVSHSSKEAQGQVGTALHVFPAFFKKPQGTHELKSHKTYEFKLSH